MMQKPVQTAQSTPKKPTVPARPNESGKLEIMDYVRIFDPNTKKTMVEQRS